MTWPRCQADRCRRVAAGTAIWADGGRLGLCRGHIQAARRIYADTVFFNIY